MSIIGTLSRSGRDVDGVILHYLGQGASRDFLPVVLHQVEAGGKRVRSALSILSCEATGGDRAAALRPAAMIELIHNYSLIADDIIDRGEIRRGLPTVRAKYSDAMALLAAMHYREVLDEIANDCPRASDMRKLMVETIKATIEGERLDILFEQAGRDEDYVVKHRCKSVSWDLYFEMIGKKTATLIRASCLAGCLAASATEEATDALAGYGWKIGLGFQVADDFLDVFGEKTGKEKGKDIIEHKLGNAVIISALEELGDSKARDLLAILRSSKVNASKLKEAMKLIDGTGAKTRTYRLAEKLVKEGKAKLEILPESSAKTALVQLADFIATRVY